MGDRATLAEAFDVQVDVDLNIGSNAYTSSGSDNYGFRIYLSKMSDRVTPDSEQGKDSRAHELCLMSLLILNAMKILINFITRTFFEDSMISSQNQKLSMCLCRVLCLLVYSSSGESQLRVAVPANTVTEHSFTVSVTVPSNLNGKFCGANYLQVFVVDNGNSQTQPGEYEMMCPHARTSMYGDV